MLGSLHESEACGAFDVLCRILPGREEDRGYDVARVRVESACGGHQALSCVCVCVCVGFCILQVRGYTNRAGHRGADEVLLDVKVDEGRDGRLQHFLHNIRCDHRFHDLTS